MAYRTFEDEQGIGWEIWDTLPRAPDSVSNGNRGGWLTFKSASEKRRLAPIPAGWEEAEAAKLLRMLARARPIHAVGTWTSEGGFGARPAAEDG